MSEWKHKSGTSNLEESVDEQQQPQTQQQQQQKQQQPGKTLTTSLETQSGEDTKKATELIRDQCSHEPQDISREASRSIKVTLSRPNEPQQTNELPSTTNSRLEATGAKQVELTEQNNSRIETERELRRIASERRKLETSNRRELETLKQAKHQHLHHSSGAQRVHSDSESQRSNEHPNQHKANEQIQSKQNPPTPKQLAIYINGKIRSNSIFCRSNPSNPFASGTGSSAISSSPLPKSNQTTVTTDDKAQGLHKSNSTTTVRVESQQGQSNLEKVATSSLVARDERKEEGLPDLSKKFDHFPVSKFLLADRIRFRRKKRKFETKSAVDLEEARRIQPEEKSKVVTQQTAGETQVSTTESAAAAATTTTTQLTSYKLNPSSMFLRKAMRYYRLWIYCANITILLGAILFIIATVYVLSDYRVRLLVSYGNSKENDFNSRSTTSNNNNHTIVPNYHSLRNSSKDRDRDTNTNTNTNANTNIRLNVDRFEARGQDRGIEIEHDVYISYSEPAILIAYIAIAIQAGVLQAIGCFGAVRMKEKWIQAFWLLILALTIFDVVFLLYWINRVDIISKSLHRSLSKRLNQNYGHELENSSSLPADLNFKMDKVLSEIMDTIQKESKCCGIYSAHEYHKSKWRQAKEVQMIRDLNIDANSEEAKLIRRVPLVPASCCRKPQQLSMEQDSSSPLDNEEGGANVILNDPQLVKRPRIPAWSPSMVVDHLETKGAQKASKLSSDHLTTGYEDTPRQDLIDTRWMGNVPFDMDQASQSLDGGESAPTEASEWIYNNQRRRLLAKQEYFKLADETRSPDSRDKHQQAKRRERRWSIQSTVDENERVLSRLINDDEIQLESLEHDDGDNKDEEDDDETPSDRQESPIRTLSDLRDILFDVSSGDSKRDENSYIRENLKWPNELELNYDQYKTIETYLSSVISNDVAPVSDRLIEKSTSHYIPAKSRTQKLLKRKVRSIILEHQRAVEQPSKRESQSSESSNMTFVHEMMQWIEADRELACAPRAYSDLTSIYPHGCQPSIKAWLDNSAHIMFVAGFCILTVLKFYSLLLLRLEIREMIHKIRVLKGMATEYNELNELEAYLPRSSICVPPEPELATAAATNVVAAAALVASASAGTATGSLERAPSGAQMAPFRCMSRSSFSDAVVAATAAAQMENAAKNQAESGVPMSGDLLGIGGARMTPMLTTSTLCARSTSGHLSSTHHTIPSHNLLSASQPATNSSAFLSRRHTAISVCPAAAAAAAATAAHHLMSRRGTYVANPVFNAAPLINPSLGPLSAHRHSAHTVYTLSAPATSNLLSPQLASQSLALGMSRQTPTQQHQQSHQAGQSSTESGGQHQTTQLLQLTHTFKRQSSAGAQSACNFPLEVTPSLAMEQRRSIH